MKNEKIAIMLKYYRTLNNLSVNDVSDILSNMNAPAAPKTIYGWESGQTQPDADMLLRLCEIYKIDDILDVFGYKKNIDNSMSLTRFEISLIRNYRKNPPLQKAVNKLLDLD